MIVFDSDKQAIFNPPSLNLDRPVDKAIMVFDDEVWEDYIIPSKDLVSFEVKNIKGRVFNTFRYLRSGEEDILLVCPSTGGSASATDLELLIASGAKKIVAFGTCGAMDKTIAKNTIILPTGAIREEGVSYHYLEPSREVGQATESIDVMKVVFEANDVDYLAGKAWTTDAVYRETAGKLESFKSIGCLAVDMELASLLAVAKFRGVKFAQFLISDDNIDGVNNKENERDSRQLLDLAVEMVSRL